MTGVGCFGKPAIQIQVLHRVMARYGSPAATDNPTDDTAWLDDGAGSLMACLSRQLRTSTQHLPEDRLRVAGFFLYLEGGKLQIRVLTQSGWSGPAWRSR